MAAVAAAKVVLDQDDPAAKAVAALVVQAVSAVLPAPRCSSNTPSDLTPTKMASSARTSCINSPKSSADDVAGKAEVADPATEADAKEVAPAKRDQLVQQANDLR